MDIIAERLRKAMNLRNMRQVDIIQATGMNKGSLSSYLSGKYQPKQTNIYLLAEVLDVNVGWLMGHDVPMEKQEVTLLNINPLFDNPEYGTEEDTLLRYYHLLNEKGQKEALKQIYALTCIDSYSQSNSKK